jgi:hypothetical protein
VEKLLREGGGSDVELREAADRIGQYYSDRQKWQRAAQHFTQVRAGQRARGEVFGGLYECTGCGAARG